jgi:phage terminase large subunit-like protein
MPKSDKQYFYKSECRSEKTLRELHAGSESQISFEQWLELRDKARKNLFWLGTAVLKKDWLPHRHQVICDFFVQKNFDNVYYEGYTLGDVRAAIGRQDECKERMLLWPRGSYKSDIDGVDSVQWVLNAPDIRIFVLSAKEDNALKFLRQIKKYFYQPEDTPRTYLQRLFPEYILTGRDGQSDSPLETPARVLKAEVEEPTLWVDAVISTLASKHCDIKKGDDVVSDKNSQTEEARVKLKNKYDNVANLLDEWGYADHIGTRYAVDDWYGTRLAVMDEAPLKYMCAAAWTVKPEFKDVKLRKIEEHMVDLLFPEKLTFKSLRAKLLNNEIDFRCQQLNEPAGGEVSLNFDIETLRAHECQPSRVPQTGNIYVLWDWALTSGKYSDYSAGVVVKIGPDRDAWVLEVVCDKFKSSELAYQIVALNKKWKPLLTIIEKSNGSELLQLELQRQANKYRLPLNNIMWRQPSNEKDAKRNRIKGLETLLNSDRLFFVQGPWIDLTFSQLVDCTGNDLKKKRKDDIPDALSYITFVMPREKRKEEKAEPSSDADRNAAQKEAMLAAWKQQQAHPELMFSADAIDALRANQTSGLELLNPSMKPAPPVAAAPVNRMSRWFKRA